MNITEVTTFKDRGSESQKNGVVQVKFPESGYSPYKAVENALSSIFPTQIEESKLLRARKILGETVEDLPDQALETFITEFQCLVDTWLDDFEKNTFEGLTLRQVLGGDKNESAK